MLLLWIIYVIYVLFLLCFRARLFIDALWSPAGKGLASWLSFVMSNRGVVTFSLLSWVRRGAWLHPSTRTGDQVNTSSLEYFYGFTGVIQR